MAFAYGFNQDHRRQIYFSAVNVISGFAPHFFNDIPTLGRYQSPKAKSKSHGTLRCSKAGLWGTAADAIAMTIDGVSYPGWTSAQHAHETAVVAALWPFSVCKAEADPDLTVPAKFQAQQSLYSRHDITQARWATVGAAITGRDDLARTCATRLHVAKTG
jgi:hypothetical protein